VAELLVANAEGDLMEVQTLAGSDAKLTGEGKGAEMGQRRKVAAGDRVRDSMHGAGMVVGLGNAAWQVDVLFDSGRRDCASAARLELLEEAGPAAGLGNMTTVQPGTAARAEVVAILGELRGVLLSIDAGSTDRRFVDFAALAGRVQECIDKVERLDEVEAQVERLLLGGHQDDHPAGVIDRPVAGAAAGGNRGA
jgi:hypothetical protein